MTVLPRLVVILRWTARIIGSIVLLLVAALAVGEGLPNPFHQPAAVNFQSLALITVLAGQVMAWWREGKGSALILGGLAAFAVANHGIRMNAVFASLLLTGVLYLFCWWSARKIVFEK